MLRQAQALLPHAHFVYIADEAAFPYGHWSDDALIAHLIDCIGRLIALHHPAMIVVACNTASTLALQPLRDAYPEVLFVGTVPAIKPACGLSRTKLVSLLATPATVHGTYTQALIERFNAGCAVTLVGAAELAALTEAYIHGTREIENAIREAIAPCFVSTSKGRTDVIGLGCTHYPLLIDALERHAPWPVTWIDPALAVARRIEALVRTYDMAGRARDPNRSGSVRFGYTSEAEDYVSLWRVYRRLCASKRSASPRWPR